MKGVSKLMFDNFNIKKLGYDFMGFHVNRNSPISFHHTILSHKVCRELGIGDGYWYWNGSILVQDTSHDFLHLIERVDEDMFYAITSELIDQNIKGHLDPDNIIRIHDVLDCFEKEHGDDRDKHGKLLIKSAYRNRCNFK